MCISVKDHEKWYGEEKIANKMEKEDLKKHFHCNLKFLNMRQNNISGMPFNYKNILKQSEPTWPTILELAAKNELDLNLKRSNLQKGDMETISYMIGENPFGASKLRNLSLSLCQIKKEGAKILAPALATPRISLATPGVGLPCGCALAQSLFLVRTL